MTSSSDKALPAEAFATIKTLCAKAWQRGLLSGFNGNVSLREGEDMIITRSGAAKGSLETADLSRVRLADGRLLAGGKASSEGELHRAIYTLQPEAKAIVHTHPPKLLALFACLPVARRLDIPIFEAEDLRRSLGFIPDFAPGSRELAEAAGLASRDSKAIWLERHGLAVWAGTPLAALALSEELEHLAGVQLAMLAVR